MSKDQFTLEDYNQDSTMGQSTKRQVGPLSIGLPEDWALIELGEIVSEITEIDHKMPDKVESGIPFVAVGDITSPGRLDLEDTEQVSEDAWERLSTKFNPDKNDILYTRFGTIGHAERVDFDEAFLASYSVALIKIEEDIESEFLAQCLNWSFLQKQAEMRTRGSANKNLNLGEIPKLVVPYPSIAEQRKIANILYMIDRLIEKTEKIINQSQRAKKGVVQNLLTKGANDHTLYQDYRLGPIDLVKPKEWDLRSFDDFSLRVQDGPHITPDYVEDGIPFVSSQNVNPFGKDFDYSQYEKYISEDTYNEINQNCRPEKGDLIISRRATIGPTQLIRHNNQFAFFVGVAIIKTDDSVHNPYLEQLMNWSVMNKLWHLKSPGSTMKTLNLGTIKEQIIPIPSIQEQKEIAEVLGSIDKETSYNQRYRNLLQRLKRGLMQDLLSGKVKTTDTNIEVPDEIAQYG